MIRETDIERLRASYAALGRGEIDAALAVLHPDAEWHESAELPGGDVLHGRTRISEFLLSFMESWKEFHQEIEGVEIADDRVALVISLEAVGRESGIAVNTRYAHVWTLRDGDGILVEAYRDPEAAVAALRERTTP